MALTKEEKARAREILDRLRFINDEKMQLCNELDQLQEKCSHEKAVPDPGMLLFFQCAICGYEPED